MASRVAWFAILAVALIPSPHARADQAVPPAKAIALGQVAGPVRIDGALDEPTWQRATWTADFAAKEPSYGAAPAHPMQVAIARDDDALYVAARMESGGDPVAAPLTRRDDTSQAERFIVSLDPYRTRRFAYSFAVTAAGTRADWIHPADDERARDASWNPVWSAAVHRLRPAGPPSCASRSASSATRRAPRPGASTSTATCRRPTRTSSGSRCRATAPRGRRGSAR